MKITQFYTKNFMYSVDKSGKLRKQINRYFLPIEINPNIILDIIRLQDKKNLSPVKIKNQTFTKISQEAKKFQLLRVTGRQLNSNFIPLNLKGDKSRQSPRRKISPTKQISKYKIQQMLSEPLENIVETISKQPDSHLYIKQLEQLSKIKNLSQSEYSLKSSKFNRISSQTQSNRQIQNRQHLQNILMSNPSLYKKMLIAFEKVQSQKLQKANEAQRKLKRASLNEMTTNKKGISALKKAVLSSERELVPHQLKKFNNFIQFRQFLMMINLSNKIIVFPENQIQYKAYICKGNNGLLVKSIIKSRPWWALRSNSDIQNCSLVWTQWKKTKLTNSLPNKQTKSEKISFYATNYYQRMNQSTTTLEQSNLSSSKQDNKTVAKTQVIIKNNTTMTTKQLQMYRIVKIEKVLSPKFINDDETQSTYLTFTKKINEKRFQEISKKYLPSQLSNYSYNLQLNKKDRGPLIMLNHVPGCLQLHSKRLLFSNMKKYYQRNGREVFDCLPQTHLIKDGLEDPNFIKFIQRWQSLQLQKNDPSVKNKTKNIWICKPGENSNRGNGIQVVSTLQQVKSLIKSMNGHKRTLIVQKYMENPYLYNKRKFDIRCYLLITTVNGILKGYFYNQGYIRTTSKEYSLKNLDNKFIHLTNDAIQKKGQQYGKFESCNKVSFSEFQKYLQSIEKEQSSKFVQARKKIKQIAVDIVNAVANKLNPFKKQLCFQLFGLDFMLDAKMKAYLIQANSNPCLEVDGSVLSKIIPSMVQNTIRVAIDPLFPPPYSQNWKTSRFSPGNAFQQNKFELIYDSLQDPNIKQNSLKIQDLKQLQEQEQQCQKQEQNQYQ